MGHSVYDPGVKDRRLWNAGRMQGAKPALKPQQVWAIRFWLDREHRLRDRAMFDLAIDSKLRGCDVVKVKIGDLVSGGKIRSRAIVTQQKTGRPVQFELLEPCRMSMQAWLERRGGALDDFVFPSRIDHANHISTRQYARLVDEWVIIGETTRPASRTLAALAPASPALRILDPRLPLALFAANSKRRHIERCCPPKGCGTAWPELTNCPALGALASGPQDIPAQLHPGLDGVCVARDDGESVGSSGDCGDTSS
jgi:hypothetical protein